MKASIPLCQLTLAIAKAKLASGVETQGQRACYRLEHFQVRECTGETVALYDGARRADLFTTTGGTTIPRWGGISRVIPSDCMVGVTPHMHMRMETRLVSGIRWDCGHSEILFPTTYSTTRLELPMD
jgi:hypothetical protein